MFHTNPVWNEDSTLDEKTLAFTKEFSLAQPPQVFPRYLLPFLQTRRNLWFGWAVIKNTTLFQLWCWNSLKSFKNYVSTKDGGEGICFTYFWWHGGRWCLLLANPTLNRQSSFKYIKICNNTQQFILEKSYNFLNLWQSWNFYATVIRRFPLEGSFLLTW